MTYVGYLEFFKEETIKVLGPCVLILRSFVGILCMYHGSWLTSILLADIIRRRTPRIGLVVDEFPRKMYVCYRREPMKISLCSPILLSFFTGQKDFMRNSKPKTHSNLQCNELDIPSC
jgi:hypothetical protein